MRAREAPFLLAAAAAVLVAGPGCQATSIRLVVDGDLRPGLDLDFVVVFLRAEGELVFRHSQALDAELAFPQSLTILPGERVRDSVEAEVTGSVAGREVVSARRTLTFAEGRQVEERVCLLAACVGSDEPGCREGRCEGTPADGDADADQDTAGDGEAEGEAQDGDLDGGEGGPDLDAEPDADLEPCLPACEGRQCGEDGCGGTCGPGCGAREGCSVLTGRCVGPGQWVSVPPGSFAMGSPLDELGREDDEPWHEVTLTRGFRILSTVVTRGEFEAVVGVPPPDSPDCAASDCPASAISWSHAAYFCNRLSARDGAPACYACSGDVASLVCYGLGDPYECTGFRLPTEAEWEYAARAGTSAATFAGDLDPERLECESPNLELDPLAWFCGNTMAMRPVGGLAANPWGLFDVLGNVREWTADWYSDDPSALPAVDPFRAREALSVGRVLRSCSFRSAGRFCRSANRGYHLSAPAPGLGFRPVQTIAP